MLRLLLVTDEGLRERIGRAGKDLIERKYTFKVYREKVLGLVDWLESELLGTPTPAVYENDCVP